MGVNTVDGWLPAKPRNLDWSSDFDRPFSRWILDDAVFGDFLKTRIC